MNKTVMEIRRQRCKHCHRTYDYHASGEGSNSPYNDREYCPECAKAIQDALAAIPVCCEKRYKEIMFDEELVAELKKIIDETTSDGTCPIPMHTSNVPCACADVVLYHNCTYAIGKDDDGNEHLYQSFEYDREKDAFTDKPWKENCPFGRTAYWREGNLLLLYKKAVPINEDSKKSSFRPIKVDWESMYNFNRNNDNEDRK